MEILSHWKCWNFVYTSAECGTLGKSFHWAHSDGNIIHNGAYKVNCSCKFCSQGWNICWILSFYFVGFVNRELAFQSVWSVHDLRWMLEYFLEWHRIFSFFVCVNVCVRVRINVVIKACLSKIKKFSCK